MPHEINLVRYAACQDEPWRNGGGTTRTLWTRGDPASPVARISVAEITRDAPFSCFPGIDRTFCALGPGPVVLWIDGAPSRLEHGQCISFAGEAEVRAQLPGGPVRALNVMTMRGHARHRITHAKPAPEGAILAVLSDGEVQGWPVERGDLIVPPLPRNSAGDLLAISIAALART